MAAILIAAIFVRMASAEKPAASVELRAGEYLWMPELAPKGSVAIIVDLSDQLAYVYRNGIRIGVSTISSGMPGFETPTGVFTILEKNREHYSNLYDNAPMPFMQRLTWQGMALHAGHVPGYPASHGCIRLPYAFSEKLFDVTARGMTVVVTDVAAGAPMIDSPGWFSPVDATTGLSRPRLPLPSDSDFAWTPDLSPAGPLTIILSAHDKEVVVLRNAVEIGRSAIVVADGAIRGTRAYMLLEGYGAGNSAVLPDKPALRWMQIGLLKTTDDRVTAPDDLRQAFADGTLRVPPEFARDVYAVLAPGTTLIVTDEPIGQHVENSTMTVIRADAPERVDPQTP